MSATRGVVQVGAGGQLVGQVAEAVRPTRPAGTGRGVPELGHWSWPGLLCGPLVLVDEAAEDRPTLDPLAGQISGRVIGPRRAEVTAAMRAPSVVMGLVLGQDSSQMPFAEDQHPVGDLLAGGEHEPLRVTVRPRAAGRDLGLDAGIGQHREMMR